MQSHSGPEWLYVNGMYGLAFAFVFDVLWWAAATLPGAMETCTPLQQGVSSSPWASY